MVFYRKYRPQKIEELDSKEIREKLYSVFSKRDYSHAFLFTGSKGLGKTSTARIIAKLINCEKLGKKSPELRSKEKTLYTKPYTLNPSVEPCNKCDQCLSITEGTNMDILEIDAASNRGIDEIRDLREKIRLSPLRAFKKVYIIDEVHMLTTEAFNALLKTLEEPPAHSVFILCTTEPQKVPATIFSRCFHVPFTLAIEEELTRSFTRIVKEEKIDIDKEALVFIASLSDGSFRDGSKILEEMLLLAGEKKITKEMVEEKYQISNIKYQISQLLILLKNKETKKGLGLVANLVKQGTDIKYFLEQMIGELHLMLLANVGIGDGKLTENQEWLLADIKGLVELLGKAYLETKYAVLPQLPLELAIIEWGEKEEIAEVARENFLDPQMEKVNPVHKSIGHSADSENFAGSSQSTFWQELINKVKHHNHSVAGVLRGCILKEIDDKKIIIETKYKFHKEKLEERKTLLILEKVAEEIVGRRIAINLVLKSK